MSNKYLFSTLLACFLLQVGLQNIQAQDYPASPLEKEGYRLIFHDEFEGKEIDRTKWIPEYLPSWPKDLWELPSIKETFNCHWSA